MEPVIRPLRIQLVLGVGLSLVVVMVGIPVVVQLRTLEARTLLRENVEPARSAVSDVHLALANAGSLLSDHLHTGDEALYRRYGQAVSTAAAAVDRLTTFTARLGPDVALRREEFDARRAAWQENVGELVRTRPVHPTDIEAQQALFEDVLVAAALLDEAITQEAVRQRDAISRAERTQLMTILVLGPAAFGTGLVVVWLATRLQLHATEAERARAEIQRLMEGKSRLIRGFSHDVKNPLGAADGYAELLEEDVLGPLTPAQRSAVAPIRRLLHAAVRIIDDVVELSRVEAGHLEIEHDWMDPRALLQDIALEYSAAASAKGLALEVDVPEPLAGIRTDAARVRQILGNLLSNATKYTPAGRIRIRGDVEEVRDGGTSTRWLCLRVSDTGPGIPEDDRERIFEEFARLEPAHEQGAGLGLAISRRVARLLGGDLTVSGGPGQGSVFTLRLPARG